MFWNFCFVGSKKVEWREMSSAMDCPPQDHVGHIRRAKATKCFSQTVPQQIWKYNKGVHCDTSSCLSCSASLCCLIPNISRVRRASNRRQGGCVAWMCEVLRDLRESKLWMWQLMWFSRIYKKMNPSRNQPTYWMVSYDNTKNVKLTVSRGPLSFISQYSTASLTGCIPTI